MAPWSSRTGAIWGFYSPIFLIKKGFVFYNGVLMFGELKGIGLVLL
jgi:hypothetical protein